MTVNNAAAAPVARPRAGKNRYTVGARMVTATAPASRLAATRGQNPGHAMVAATPIAPASAGSAAR